MALVARAVKDTQQTCNAALLHLRVGRRKKGILTAVHTILICVVHTVGVNYIRGQSF